MFKQDGFYISLPFIKKQYAIQISVENLNKIPRREITKILKSEEQKDRELFLRSLFAQWINQNYQPNFIFLGKAKKLFRKLKLTLTEEDRHDFDLLEERIFSLNRHIKILEVTNPLENKEQVGIKFDRAAVYLRKERLEFMFEGVMLASNKRIIIEVSKDKVYSYYWNDIVSIRLEHYGLEIDIKNSKIVFRIHDQETLNNTLKNYMQKKVKNAIKKCENN